METLEIIEQLGVTSEDALFIQQVLSEIDSDGGSNVTVDTESLVEQANANPAVDKIPVENNDATSRFSSAIWYEKIQQQTIILAGLGGIGSYLNFLLSRMHPASMFLYDDDAVETVNLSGQLYTMNDVGKMKTIVSRDMARSYSDYGDIFTVEDKFTETSQAGNIMICGFDNMDARRVFFNKWRNHVRSFTDVSDRAKCLFIDGRLAAESFQVLCIKGDDPYAMEKYEEHWLFSDSEAEETICSYKQTSFCANMIASVMVNCFVNFIANQCNPIIPRDVPFYTEYDASMMFFKTES